MLFVDIPRGNRIRRMQDGRNENETDLNGILCLIETDFQMEKAFVPFIFRNAMPKVNKLLMFSMFFFSVYISSVNYSLERISFHFTDSIEMPLPICPKSFIGLYISTWGHSAA